MNRLEELVTERNALVLKKYSTTNTPTLEEHDEMRLEYLRAEIDLIECELTPEPMIRFERMLKRIEAMISEVRTALDMLYEMRGTRDDV